MSVIRCCLVVFFIVLAALLFVACGGTEATVEKEEPAVVEEIAGTEFNRVTLTEQAAQRLGIQSEAVREEEVDGTMKLVVPYSAVIYGLHGETFAYVRNPEANSLVFMRAPITVERIDGGRAILSDGPASGTHVVTVGVAELYGADTGVGK
jgi:multidrug efflux pump subunit AcrA (membrane-fusion protein)